MKHFLFIKETSKTAKHGSRKLYFRVYEIVNNEVQDCGYFSESSGAYKGDESAVMNHLGRNGKIDAQYAEGYFRHDNGNFKLTEL